MEEAFSIDKRSYDETMLGVLAVSSPFNSNVGVSRVLTYDTNILSTRGLMKTGNLDNPQDLNIANLLSIPELLTPCVVDHDSAARVAMLSQQSKQLIPTKSSSSLLIGNGSEKALSHVIGSDFVTEAKDDGFVKEFDEKSKMMIIEYNNGDNEVIDLSPAIAKNGQGGFYISNNKESDLKVGDKFKKGEIIAKNNNYFKGDKSDTHFEIGKMVKIMIGSADFTHEDSSLVTERLGDFLTSYITMKKEKVLDKSSNIDYIVKVGQEIKTGEPLLIFEQGYEEEEVNQMLAKIADEYQEEITKLGKNTLTSKYTGIIQNIEIFYACEIDEMSPSLQKIVKSYIKGIKDKEKILKKCYKDPLSSGIILPPTGKSPTKNGKIMGVTVGDGILIRFYITYEDVLGVGDKISYSTALKSVISRKVPNELAPYSEYNKDEPVDAIMSYISVNARMTTSIYLLLYGNKVLVNAKRLAKEIWDN